MTPANAIAASGCGCDRRDMAAALISLDEALARIATAATPIARTEVVPLAQALGRILADPVHSRAPAPAFDAAAMDGYGVATAALSGDGPWTLKVTASARAGHAAAARIAGLSAARVLTGAPVPAGADAVVMQEEVDAEGGHIRLTRRPAIGENIRPAGSDMAAGARVLEAGRLLGPRGIAAAAAAGAGRVRVRAQVRVALLVTGDELRAAGEERAGAQIWDVNTPMLRASLAAAGVRVVACAHGADDRAGLERQLREMAHTADLIVTSGGVSVGDADHVKPAFAALGARTLFSGVAIKPGKPVTVGRLGDAFWLGLPGNPVSAFVCWQVFGLALLRGLTGACPEAAERRRHVVLAHAIRHKPGRCELRPAVLAGFDALVREVARCGAATHSARVGPLAEADGLLFLPAECDDLPAGALVEFLPFCQS